MSEYPQEWKVEYHLPNGFTSTAYIEVSREGQEICGGTDKHTDERVTVRWTGERWVEMQAAPPLP